MTSLNPYKKMDDKPVVKEELTTPQPSEGTEQEATPEVVAQPVPGSKTDPELLLKSLQEEREKRRLAEERAKILEEQTKTSNLPDDEFSDEGKVLKKEISSLSQELKSLKEEKEMEKLYAQYPVLKEKDEEFKTFQADYPRNKLENVAKLFLAENGMIEPRKGLEKTTGGNKTPSPMGMSAADVKALRETNYRKYEEMVLKGQLKIV